jgi:acyl-CoA oxidase
MAPLSGGRFFIANNCATLGLEALTIGIRYSAVRRQFNTKPNEQEKLLIEYPLTQRRLMPLLAQTIVYLTASMKNIYDWDINQGEIQNPSNPIIESLHAISTVMKAQTSWFATECIKESRQICGGHGYNSVNKLGVLYNDNDINVTW